MFILIIQDNESYESLVDLQLKFEKEIVGFDTGYGAIENCDVQIVQANAVITVRERIHPVTCEDIVDVKVFQTR